MGPGLGLGFGLGCYSSSFVYWNSDGRFRVLRHHSIGSGHERGKQPRTAADGSKIKCPTSTDVSITGCSISTSLAVFVFSDSWIAFWSCKYCAICFFASMTGRQTFPFVAACKQSSETDGAKTTYFSTLWCLSQAPTMEIYSELHTYEISICHGGFCRTICSVVGSACLHKPVKARKCSCEFSKGQGRNKLFPSGTAEKIEMS